MFKIPRRSPNPDEIRFCDRCSTVCDRRCQTDAVYERARDRWLLYGWRLA